MKCPRQESNDNFSQNALAMLTERPIDEITNLTGDGQRTKPSGYGSALMRQLGIWFQR